MRKEISSPSSGHSWRSPAALHLEDATSPVAVASAIGGGAVLGDYLFRMTVSGIHGTDARLVPVRGGAG